MEKRTSTVISRGIAALGMTLLPWQAYALNLGPLHWKAPAGQAAYAEIELRNKGPIATQAVRASLASREAYSAAGLNYHPAFSSLRTSVLPGENGQAVLKLDQLPQDAESLDFLVVVNDKLALALAEYRVNPRQGAQDIPPAPAGTLQLKARTPNAAKPVKSQPLAPPAAAPTLPPATTAATTTPAAAPATTVPPSPPTAVAQPNQEESVVREALQAWVKAWSERNTDAYIAAYTADFPGKDAALTHEAWLEQRRARIQVRKQISVELSNIRLERQGDAYVATFEQRYRSDGIRDRMRKQLVLIQDKGNWLIQRETALP